MNIELYEGLFNSLREYIKENSKFQIHVMQKPNSELFPKVIVEEIMNVSAVPTHYRMESLSNITYEINIYAKDAEIDGDFEDSMDIARYIQSIVSDYMEHKIHLKRVFCEPTPNIDDTVYRITMRYTGQASDYRGHFF